MAIDRAGRANHRWRQRATSRMNATAGTKRDRAGTLLGVEGLINSGAQHQLEHLKQIEIITEDDRESGSDDGPLDLDSGVVRLRHRGPDAEPDDGPSERQ